MIAFVAVLYVMLVTASVPPGPSRDAQTTGTFAFALCTKMVPAGCSSVSQIIMLFNTAWCAACASLMSTTLSPLTSCESPDVSMLYVTGKVFHFTRNSLYEFDSGPQSVVSGVA